MVIEYIDLYVNWVLDLQNLALRRDLISRIYSAEELNSMTIGELKMLRLSLHELLYAPPER